MSDCHCIAAAGRIGCGLAIEPCKDSAAGVVGTAADADSFGEVSCGRVVEICQRVVLGDSPCLSADIRVVVGRPVYVMRVAIGVGVDGQCDHGNYVEREEQAAEYVSAFTLTGLQGAILKVFVLRALGNGWLFFVLCHF